MSTFFLRPSAIDSAVSTSSPLYNLYSKIYGPVTGLPSRKTQDA